jgi:uncharacterized protein with ParB-like and HNH nuclease domain
MNIKEAFEKKIKIEPKVMAIETLFNNERRLKKTHYDPPYQRNYVWDSEKATYFIESILLGTEIPPLIFFKNPERVEVIDGRQRYQTILKFIKGEFKLSKAGLGKLVHLGNKYFKNLGELKDLFWDTKLRIIEFSFHDTQSVKQQLEDKVKIEIFKRYNSGITPLKATELDKANYLENDLNSHFKSNLNEDQRMLLLMSDIFYSDPKDIEFVMKKVRMLLALHYIPIRRYAIQKDKVINKFYDFLTEEKSPTEVEQEYNNFISKINIVHEIKKKAEYKNIELNKLQFECIFWALQVLEKEKKDFNLSESLQNKLILFLKENSAVYTLQRSSFFNELVLRYFTTSKFFENNFDVNLQEYVSISDDFKKTDKEITNKKTEESATAQSFEALRINKPEPSSITIEDICRQMNRQRFLLRPPYQRSEVINKKKSSAIIESIFLGIKIPPIFIYKRKDGVSEVLDGQQRLLSILGYTKKTYLDEKKQSAKSEKHGYRLSLKNGILTDLDGKTFDQLSLQYQEKLLEYDLWIIEIDEKNNEGFDPIDLFIRLNYKPYPIKENTFEMWNSYIDRTIISEIKKVHEQNENWFYFRKNNSRMSNESVLTALGYLEYKFATTKYSKDEIPKYLDFYKIGDKINFRIKSKNDITRILEDDSAKSKFLSALNSLSKNFIQKVEVLSSSSDNFNDNHLLENLDNILDVDRGKRTQQGFYALWYFLSNIPLESINLDKPGMKKDIAELFGLMSDIGVQEKDDFIKQVKAFWKKYEK